MGKASRKKKAHVQAKKSDPNKKIKKAQSKAKGGDKKDDHKTELHIDKEKSDKKDKKAPIKEHKEAFNSLIKDKYQEFKDGIDPDKAEILKKETKIILKKGACYLAGIVSVVAILIVIELHSDNRVFPGTKVGNIDLSYVEAETARDKLVTAIRDYFEKPLVFTYKGETKEITAEELGIRIAVDQTASTMPVFEFEKENPAQLLASLFISRHINLDYTLDGDKIIKVVEQKFNLTDKRAKNARLVATEEGFTVEPEANGVAIKREQLLTTLRKKINKLNSNPISLELQEEQPRVVASELEKEKDRLIGLLQNPLTLFYEDESLTLTLMDHLDAVTFEESSYLSFTNQGTQFPVIISDSQLSLDNSNPINIESRIQIEVNADKIAEYLHENLIVDIEIPTSPANLFTDADGNVVIEGKGENGQAVPNERLVRAIALAVNNSITDVPVPVVIDKAELTISDDLKDMGIKELLATGHSAYYGSPPNRMFNIDYGTAKYNGLLIAPGEEFSFNTLLGPVDAGSGFKPEKVIKKDKLELEYGGGICQVSTTMYRAVLQAGLPITARKPHSWKVSYYGQSMGHGLDATIYPGVSDLKFINDTPGHLLVQAYTEGAEDYFKLYGTHDGRITELEGPIGGGLTYRWNRHLTKNGETSVEEIWSKYRPIPPPEPVEKPDTVAQVPETPQVAPEFSF